MLCYHCEEPHEAGNSKKCSKHRQEEEIAIIKHNEKVNWLQAKQLYFQTHPDEESTYAMKVKKVSEDKKKDREADEEIAFRRRTAENVSVEANVDEPNTVNEPHTISEMHDIGESQTHTDSSASGGPAKRSRSFNSDEEPYVLKRGKPETQDSSDSIVDVNMPALECEEDTSETCERIRKEALDIFNNLEQ